MSERPLRIGTLGAARIAPAAIVKPARDVDDAELFAVAARDPAKAAKFARKHGVPRVHDTYDALLADDEIDAVYNPLPNGLHGVWTLRAIAAGKPVLCEKPLTANAAEAEQVAAAAEEAGLVVMEAFHYRYHPLAARMKEIVDSGELGSVRRLESWMCIPLPLFKDIRYRLDLAGGAVMDVGCYGIHQLRVLAGAEPTVTAARARLRSPQVDRWMQADFEWADGRTGQMTCALWSASLLKVAVRVTGAEGEMRVLNPARPQSFHRLTVRTKAGKRRERVKGDATYTYQLRAFVAAARDGAPVLTPLSDSVANMRVIDDVYRKAGLDPRSPSAA
ncbi:MAG: Gfo/Idh/MocA family protein [Acidimicrobiia bacterium]